MIDVGGCAKSQYNFFINVTNTAKIQILFIYSRVIRRYFSDKDLILRQADRKRAGSRARCYFF